MTSNTVRVLPGPSFAHGSAGCARRRPPLGGVSRGSEIAPALEAALGKDAVLLTDARSLVVQADVCTRRGEALHTEKDWWAVIHANAFQEVHGAFVVAWRTGTGGVHLVRDPIGHRTLYYAVNQGQLTFASTLRALLDSGALPRRLDLRSVAAYLAYAYVPGRDTLVEGAFEVLPGEHIAFEGSSLARHTFWEIPTEPTSYESEAALERQLRRVLEEQVSAALPAGSPVAASLSGGIDSSLIVALAQRLHSEPVHTFSITFGAPHKDELEHSALVARHCKTKHTVVLLTAEAIVAHLDDTIACLSKPNGDPLTVPNALLFRQMAEHAGVALNGEGGDPCFGGPKNVPMVLAELYGEDPADEHWRERSYLRAHGKCSDELEELLEPEVFRAISHPLESDLEPWFTSRRWSTLVGRLLAINVRFKGGHHILPKVDALSAPFGVLARSPLFDRSLVELAFAIPPQLKLHGATEKYLLKRAVHDLLPAEIVNRPKSGMMVPVEGWFSGPLLAEAGRRIEQLIPHGLFRRRYLDDLLSARLGGLRPRRGVKIWLLLTLESHLRALGFGSL